MKAFLVLFTSLCLFACGNDDSDSSASKTPLEGHWLFDVGGGCTNIMVFSADEYSFLFGCMSGDSLRLDIQNGTFTVADDTASFTPLQATCPGVKGSSGRFVVTEKTLSFIKGSRSTTLSKYEPTGDDEGGYTTTTGCFDDEGEFTEYEIKDL